MRLKETLLSKAFSLESFEHLTRLRKDIVHALREAGMINMTHIQHQFLGRVFSEPRPQKSLILGETGSGKTLCYALPIVNSLIDSKQYKEPHKASLILTASRELVSQVASDIKKLDPLDLVSVVKAGSFLSKKAYEPRKIPPELRPISKNLTTTKSFIDFSQSDVIVSTPSQIDLLYNYERIKSDVLDYLVIDEADVLLDKNQNHKKAVNSILKNLSDKGQTRVIIAAASFDRKIKGQDFIEYLQCQFPRIAVFQSDSYMKVNPLVEHVITEVDNIDPLARLDLLLSVILTSEYERFLIFCNTNQEVDEVHYYLEQRNISSIRFISSLSESQRINALCKFKSDKNTILVASDLANRGLHFDFDPHVVQFSCAQNAITLLHRFGRTGRLGKKGRVTSFITNTDVPLLSSFQDLTSQSLPVAAITSRKRSFNKKLLK